jgi:DNA-binding LytR/AlgR family response regulator
MLTCYVIDDEAHAIKSLVAYINRTPVLQLTGFSENPLDALSFFQQQKQYPDITFLDIEMPQVSGIELGKMLRDKTAVVFTTAHPDFAVGAFELDISDYLLKPFSFERFLKSVNKISDRIAEKRKNHQADDFFYIQTEVKGKLIKLQFDEIIFMQSQKNYLSIVTKDKKHLTYLSLSEIEEKLPASFLRVSKSFIVNTDKITRLEGDELFLEDEVQAITIGTSYKEAFAAFMKDHLIKTKRSPGH